MSQAWGLLRAFIAIASQLWRLVKYLNTLLPRPLQALAMPVPVHWKINVAVRAVWEDYIPSAATAVISENKSRGHVLHAPTAILDHAYYDRRLERKMES